MMRNHRREFIGLVCICAAYLGLTLYHLRDLPGEWYGDISIEHQVVTLILSGRWPWQFSLSAGPAYHYIVAAFAYFLGATYQTYKLVSVTTGLAVILLTYLLGKELAGPRVGLLAALAGALSFWLILFARLGSSPQILSPVLSAGSIYFLLRFSRTQRWYDAALSMVFAGWGLFTYPSTFVLPIAVLVLIAWQIIFTRPRAAWWRALAVTCAVLLPFVVWFAFTIKTNIAFGQNGYVGSKIVGHREPFTALALTFGKNMIKALGIFQWIGDGSFRTNVPGSPILDPISGLMLDLGLIWLFLNPRLRPRWGYVIAPLILLLMPSAAPGILPNEIPSASRSLGAAPFVFMLVGTGLEAVHATVQHWVTQIAALPAQSQNLPGYSTAGSLRAPQPGHSIPLTGAHSTDRPGGPTRWFSGGLISIILVGIGFFNINHYFVHYAGQLPGHNQDWSLLIAQYIETLPAHTPVKMTACCWEDVEQPSLQVVSYRLEEDHFQANLDTKAYLRSCDELSTGQTYVLIFPPKEASNLVNEFRGCFPNSWGEMHYDKLGQPAFYSLSIDLPLYPPP